MVSATMADTIQNRLQQYITMYRTKKARNDLAYAQKLYSEARSQYIKSQEVYSSYSDANEDLILQSYKSKQDELENEMQLRYNIYNQSVQQLQLAKAKVQEQTPAFTIIQGASVPIKATSTPRTLIVLIYIIIGVIFDTIWILEFHKILKHPHK
jgi:LPS O-antigen subunit length determinant protein (WzzB/FepE family)